MEDKEEVRGLKARQLGTKAEKISRCSLSPYRTSASNLFMITSSGRVYCISSPSSKEIGDLDYTISSDISLPSAC
jgi:hypothetical protein